MPVIRSSSYPAELEDFLVYRHPDHQDQLDREAAPDLQEDHIDHQDQLERQDFLDHHEALERQEILDHQRFLALVDEFQWWLEEILEEEDDDIEALAFQEAHDRQEILDHQRFLALVDEFQWWLDEIMEEDDDIVGDGGDSQGAHQGGPPRPNHASQHGDQ
ncbi:hypothetical protein EYF80_063588 [Liparis tanakae]|uniref:Uncharacterized protein n=1 Tax=Liparis tanakae TaxID=230148 RepID=A0A4Z2EBR3_9TELE|nr:hypothetical protein EYF80_063588 [Liparis tanakae]